MAEEKEGIKMEKKKKKEFVFFLETINVSK
jgi:hypothetical protein